MKRHAFILGCLLLATLAAAQAQLYTTNNGTITITRYLDTNRAVIIPDTITGMPVTSIADGAFYEDTSVPKVTIPNSVTSIGSGAFAGCISLTSVTLPSGATNIGDSAFYYCNRLATVTIPDSVISIGSNAFYHCLSLTSVTIPSALTSIGGSAFGLGTNLTAINVETNNPVYSSLNGVLFNKNKSTLIEYPPGKVGPYSIPHGVTEIGDGAFSDCFSLTGITIPSSVTTLGDRAFEGCSSLASVPIPSSVTSIRDYALAYCTDLSSITIPNSITEIGNGVFDYCSSLSSVTIPNSVTRIGSEAFGWCGSLTNVTIPDGVTSIGPATFTSCINLSSATIASSVTNIGRAAFGCCNSLTNVYFQGNAPGDDSSVFSCRDVDSPSMAPVTSYYLPGTVGRNSTLFGRPTAAWTLPYPLILTRKPNLGVRSHQFGFTVSWATNLNVVVEATSDLMNPIWSPVATNALTGGASYFSDPQWPKYPNRFYRLRWP